MHTCMYVCMYVLACVRMHVCMRGMYATNATFNNLSVFHEMVPVVAGSLIMLG